MHQRMVILTNGHIGVSNIARTSVMSGVCVYVNVGVCVRVGVYVLCWC